MDLFLLQRVVFETHERVRDSSPQSAKLLDVSDEDILLIFKHLGIKEELSGDGICKASGAFALAMTCNRLRSIFQKVVRTIDASEPCSRNNRCTCRATHELQLKIWVSGQALRSVSLPRIMTRAINSILIVCACFCPYITHISFHDNGLLENFTTRYLCGRLKMQSISVSNPRRLFLETLDLSRIKLRVLVLTEIEPEYVPAVKNVIRSTGSHLRVLLVDVLLHGPWRCLEGRDALDILCRILTTTINGVLENRNRCRSPVEGFEISISSTYKKLFGTTVDSIDFPSSETKTSKDFSVIEGSASD